jgi:hypothetical protein
LWLFIFEARRNQVRMMLRIAVIDGQGGSIGRQIIETIRREIYWDVEIIALGTNAMATTAMLKAGANKGATGENAITGISQKVDYILGPVGIIVANAMKGEITSMMAFAIAESLAGKLLIPQGRCNIEVAGVDKSLTASQFIEKAVGMIKGFYNEQKQNGW